MPTSTTLRHRAISVLFATLPYRRRATGARSLFSRTAGVIAPRDRIAACRIGRENGFTVEATEDAASSPNGTQTLRAGVFLNTQATPDGNRRMLERTSRRAGVGRHPRRGGTPNTCGQVMDAAGVLREPPRHSERHFPRAGQEPSSNQGLPDRWTAGRVSLQGDDREIRVLVDTTRGNRAQKRRHHHVRCSTSTMVPRVLPNMGQTEATYADRCSPSPRAASATRGARIHELRSVRPEETVHQVGSPRKAERTVERGDA